MKKIAFFSGQYPVDTKLGGIGLRILEIAEVLSKNFNIRIITPQPTDIKHDLIDFFNQENHSCTDILNWCDVAYFSDMPNYSLLVEAHSAEKIIICDNALPIEQMYYNEVKYTNNPDLSYKLLLSIFKLQIIVSDIFLVRSDVEKATLIASLVLLGRFNSINFNVSSSLDHMVFDLPIGFNLISEKNKEQKSDNGSMVDYIWSGGVWDFYDACAVIKAILFSYNNDKEITLKFLYPMDKETQISEQIHALELLSQSKIYDSVQLPDSYIKHHERDFYMKSAKALIFLSKPGIENQTCYRLRIRDVFLYELPIIVDNHGATGEFVRNTGIGLAIDTKDPEKIALNMRRLLLDKELYDNCIRNIKLLRHNHIYDYTLKSLEKRLSSSSRSPDIKSLNPKKSLESVLQEIYHAEEVLRK